MASPDDVAQSQYLTCRIADEEYGIGILEAREILEYETLTRVPNAPPFIRGVINLRGRVVPVVDLAIKFGLEPRPLHRRACIIIVETGAEDGPGVVGLVADAVSQVIELAPDAIEPPPTFGTRARGEHLRGLGRSGNRFVLLLALDRILADTALMAGTAEASVVGDGSHPADAAELAEPAQPATPAQD